MKLAHLTLIIAIATTGCATERVAAPAPHSDNSSIVSLVASNAMQVPLLYVVDGVRLQRDQVPSLTADEVLSVSVMKGHLALKKYGPEAAYGVVVIKTKAANIPQT
ncbi:MAG TPA: hypothetical protein VJ840_11940 [Gemmatimonadaceae bacterium]|nr:hypothetical protein [Gemmatimonadaceae bacterium]